MAWIGTSKGRRKSKNITFGKTFRTKAGRLGRYVYVRGKRVGFEAVKEFKRQSRQTYYREKTGREYYRR